MRTWSVWEKVFSVFDETWYDYVGKIEARTEQSALNKARKEFKWDRGGVPNRRRKVENFVVR